MLSHLIAIARSQGQVNDGRSYPDVEFYANWSIGQDSVPSSSTNGLNNPVFSSTGPYDHPDMQVEGPTLGVQDGSQQRSYNPSTGPTIEASGHTHNRQTQIHDQGRLNVILV